MLAYNEFEYKKTINHCKLEDRFQKKAIFQLHTCKFADKKTAYNEGRLYFQIAILCDKRTRKMGVTTLLKGGNKEKITS